ncbi:hypothetical protein DPMN_101916 [Dreissena polymorpha]|uniref:Uncharacterized protein n=1 Tax=Dreissena polymorpha TaxID=45954 RepID=A0A9D4RAI0_DREPO|nr:hypothetical protein DPMN_101916 [Dreissena polymorpha]
MTSTGNYQLTINNATRAEKRATLPSGGRMTPDGEDHRLHQDPNHQRPERHYTSTSLSYGSRWTVSVQKRLTSVELQLFSGNEQDDAAHTQGIAQRALIGWEAHGPRIMVDLWGIDLPL